MKGDITGLFVLVLWVLGGLMGYWIGHENGKAIVRKEAVEHHVGKWVPDTDGKTEFKWEK